jgi:hypothetical protein
MVSKKTIDRNNSSTEIYWSEIPPCDHTVHIYEDDALFLKLLHSFVVTGIRQDEGVILVATKPHLLALEKMLVADSIDMFTLKVNNRLILLDAEETLARFMVNGWPDEILFNHLISSLLDRARGGKKRRVRAFGEMVAVLWAQGFAGATVALEHHWDKLCKTEQFCLFCAYPKSGFTQDAHSSIDDICKAHSRVLAVR